MACQLLQQTVEQPIPVTINHTPGASVRGQDMLRILFRSPTPCTPFLSLLGHTFHEAPKTSTGFENKRQPGNEIAQKVMDDILSKPLFIA